MRMV